MARLSNPYLNASNLISELKEKAEKGHLHLDRVQKSVASLYFPGLPVEEAEACIANDRRFSDYPDLQAILKDLLSIKEINLEKVKNLKKHIQGRDWQAPNSRRYFNHLNQKLGYFDETNEVIQTLYQSLVEASRAMIVMIETNNTPQDYMAYEYAYKMMALFVDDVAKHEAPDLLNLIDGHMAKLLKSFHTKVAHPYHDALLTNLILPVANELKDRAGWVRLVAAHGVSIYPALGFARQIEALNEGYAPQNLDAAQALVAQCHYPRASEDTGFAALCHSYKVSEYRFDRCLDYIRSGWPKKAEDNLPNASVIHENFTFSKLPATDKRALILGDITDCCQSIGGLGEACVKDASEYSDNGIYILKDKNKIIGQAYGWISLSGNLCLDSIECLNHSIKPEGLKTILTQFAENILATYPNIQRVTLGTGGKTPKDLMTQVATTPEAIRQGQFYGDAERQYLVARRSSRLTEEQQQSLDELLLAYSSEFYGCIYYLCEHLSDTSDAVSALIGVLRRNPDLPEQLNLNTIHQFLYFSSAATLSDLEPISLEALADLPTEAQQSISAARIFWNQTDPDEIKQRIPYTPENYRLRVINKYCLLHHFEAEPADLNDILNQIPESERLNAVQTTNSNGHSVLHVISSLEALCIILEALPQKERLAAMQTKDRAGRIFLHEAAKNPEVLSILLEELPIEDRLVAMRQVRDSGNFCSLHNAAKSPKALGIILSALPLEDRLDVVREKDRLGRNLLHYAVENLEALSIILEALPSEDRLAVVQLKDKAGSSALDEAVESLEALSIILESLPSKDNLAAVKQVRDKGDCSVLHLAAKRCPKALKSILKAIPKEKRLDEVQTMDSEGFSVLHEAVDSPEALSIILEALPIEDRLAAVQVKSRYGSSVMHYAVGDLEALGIILRSLPKEERLVALLTEDSDGCSVLDEAADSPEVLRGIREILGDLGMDNTSRQFKTALSDLKRDNNTDNDQEHKEGSHLPGSGG